MAVAGTGSRGGKRAGGGGLRALVKSGSVPKTASSTSDVSWLCSRWNSATLSRILVSCSPMSSRPRRDCSWKLRGGGREGRQRGLGRSAAFAPPAPLIAEVHLLDGLGRDVSLDQLIQNVHIQHVIHLLRRGRVSARPPPANAAPPADLARCRTFSERAMVAGGSPTAALPVGGKECGGKRPTAKKAFGKHCRR